MLGRCRSTSFSCKSPASLQLGFAQIPKREGKPAAEPVDSPGPTNRLCAASQAAN